MNLFNRKIHTWEPQWQRQWLIQRYEKPRNTESPLAQISLAFSFGGGLINGGLPKEAAEILNKIMIPEYMGSAEYEFGILRETIAKIAKYREFYDDGSVTLTSIPACKLEYELMEQFIKKDGSLSKNKKLVKHKLEPRTKTIYYFAPHNLCETFVSELKDIITNGDYNGSRRFKEHPMIQNSIFPENEKYFDMERDYDRRRYENPDTVAWIDLDNAIFFTQNKEINDNFLILFKDK